MALLTALPLPAQPEGPVREGDLPPKILRFYYLSLAGADDAAEPEADFLFRNGKETTSVTLGANSFSSLITYHGTTPVTLFRERATETGVEREELGRLEFPPIWQGALFLVMRDPANPRFPFHFHPVEYWAPSIPESRLRLVNFTAGPLAAKIEESKGIVSSRQTADFVLPATPEFPIRIAMQRQDRWRLLLSTRLAQPAQSRLLVLAVPQPNNDRPRLLMLDTLPEPPPSRP